MNLFESAKLLEATAGKVVSRKESKKVKPGIVLRRKGTVVKDTTVHVVQKSKVRKKAERVDYENMVPSSLVPTEMRKELGKRVYEERCELIAVLVKGYGDKKEEIQFESVVSLRNRLSEIHSSVGKSAKVQMNPKPVVRRTLGELMKGFKVVSSVECKAPDYVAMQEKAMEQKAWNRLLEDE